MARSPLWDNPDFIADCKSNMKKREIMEKWGVSSGLVVDVRKELGGPRMVLVSDAKPVERPLPEERTEDSDGNIKIQKVADRIIPLSEWLDDLRKDGYDPDQFNTSHSHSVWTQHTREQVTKILYANKFSATKKTGIELVKTLKLENLYAEALVPARPRSLAVPQVLGTVIVISDWQVGKTGRRGGTPELLQRITEARLAVERELLKRRPQRILLLEGGDPIEGFESGGNPMFTNDLSLPDQLNFYTTEAFKFVRLAHSFAPVDVGVVPSNHAAWRRAKQNLGLPSDDWGLYAHREIRKVAEAAGLDTTWHFPEPYDESLCVDFQGTPVGLVHGNQFGPGKAIEWWTQQAMGDQPVARADILITGHYHSFGAGVAGQNPFTKRERMWLGAPTLDSGSDWYRNIKGRDSLPGTMIFDITERGFDLASLSIL